MKITNRYNRNCITAEEQTILSTSKVLIAGCGGLGASVVTNLISIGVENIVLLDCDEVEETNFNRQFIHKEKNLNIPKTLSAKEFVNEFNSNVSVELINQKFITQNAQQIVKNVDCVIDCFDNWNSKLLLNKTCVNKGIPMVHGGVEKLFGQVFTVKPNGPCLECFVENNKSEVEKQILAPIVNLIGALMAFETFKVLTNTNEEFSQILMYDFIKSDFKKIKVSKNSHCKVCGNL